MSMFINSNASSLNALRNFNKTNFDLNKSMERLASGYKVNKASDGAASLIISETLRGQIRGYAAATTNVQQGIGVLGTADSAMQEISEHLQTIREIAVQAGNTSNTPAMFTAFNNQITQEVAAITQISGGTKYNTSVLLDGSLAAGAASYSIQMGPNGTDTLDIKSAFTTNTYAALAGAAPTTLVTAGNATTLLTQVDTAIAALNGHLATVGGFEDQLDNQMNYLSIASENVTASEASIRNTDIAYETANLARLQILQQAGAFALATANSNASVVLRLLQ
jgi:flagellin